MTTNAITALAQLEQSLKTDLMQTVGTPVLTFLQSTQTIAENLAANATPSAAQIAESIGQEQAAWITFVAGALGSLPNLGAEGVGALTQFLITKVQGSLTSDSAPAATAAVKSA